MGLRLLLATRRVGLGEGEGVRLKLCPLNITGACIEGEKHCCLRKNTKHNDHKLTSPLITIT